ncbi:Metalloprotease [Calocera viscosa TUFC12733]|uniref:Metalloprotease n=1 Tax=Calocera viscosa (strain TUFC12733) TaxID=1330018 RepID=A0A167L5D6_CALVF|nr:Metalloprotease [Calocera viscosa TUFC12733]
MAEDDAPRPSVDDESAPLLNGDAPVEPSFLQRLTASTEELTPLSKVLALIALILLILSSVFIGLFAGAQTRLNSVLDTPIPTVTETQTEVRTDTYTVTKTAIEEHTQTWTATKTWGTTVTATRIATVTASPPEKTPDKGDAICISADCIRLSAAILSNIDQTADPCEDFFQFASGGWVKEHPLPADKGLITSFDLLSIENKRIIEQILTNPPLIAPSPADAITLSKLQTLYGSCMDEGTLQERGENPLVSMVEELKILFEGGIGENHLSAKDDQRIMKELPPKGLTAALAWLHSKGVEVLFSFMIDGDAGVDPDAMTVWVSQPDLGLPSKEYYEEEDILELYTSVLARIFLELSPQPATPPPAPTPTQSPWPWPWPRPTPCDCPGDEPELPPAQNRTIQAQKLAERVVAFEQAIARAGADLDFLQGDPLGTYNPVPFSNLTDSLPSISFGTFFSAFALRSFPERIILTYPPYLKDLKEILDYTPPQVLLGHFTARLVLSYTNYLSTTTELWQAKRKLTEVLSGIKPGSMTERSEWCLGVVESALGFAAGRPFVQRTFAGSAREKGTKVITDVISAFKHRLPDLSWMDKKSAKAAAEKADAIRVKVGYPLSPNTTDDVSIARYYSLVPIKNETFFENVLSAQVADTIRMWAKVGKRRDKEEWEMIPSEVNAYFNPPANEIVFPAGILRPPFFSADWPSYLSYGAFGSVSAHELTHAFDSAGRMYNQQGKLEEWWTNTTSAAYDERVKCISEQYSKYWVDDGKGGKAYVNGNLTSGENIGDAGIALSYRAWEAQYNSSWPLGGEYLLPGLNYTREQLFFISFARTWSSNAKPATALQRVRTDPHSPPRFRTNGPLSNLPEFAKAFNCSVGKPLNPPPERQCHLW